MASYITRRLILMIFTIWGVMTVTFALVQFVPGGPVERIVAQLQGQTQGATSRVSGGGSDVGSSSGGAATGSESGSAYRGAQGLDPEFIKSLEKQFGLDKPWYERYGKMLTDYSTFNFGESYFRKIKATDLIKEKLPVSISLGLWLTLFSYLISIPLGIRKAVKAGSKFDSWSSVVIAIAYGLPGFMVGVFLIILLGGGTFPFKLIEVRGLTGDNWADLSFFGKVVDYIHHLIPPLFCLALSSFAVLTLLTRNSFLDEINKQYVLTARMKGLSESRVLYGHVFRNAMLIVIAAFPSTIIHAFFTGALLIEIVFGLDGLGLLSYESIIGRDYPIVFANLFIFSLIGLVANLLSDLLYTWIDPRIDFESRKV